MIDGAEGFGRIGIVTLLGNSDFMPGILWEKERFWIRIRKTGDDRNTEASQRTMIQEIWMNATEITAEETMDQEVFSVEANEKKCCVPSGSWKYYKSRSMGAGTPGIFRGAACEASAGL